MTAAAKSPLNASAGAPKRGTNRLDGVDMLRFLLAVAVMLTHYILILPTVQFADDLPHGPRFMIFTRYGLEIFFIVSGMVIFQTGRSRTFVQFWTNRFVRVIPTLFLCATATYLIVEHLGTPTTPGVGLKRWLASVTFLPLAISDDLGVDWSYWTLTLETRFYILASLFFMFVRTTRQTLVSLAVWLVAVTVASATGSHLLQEFTLAKAAPSFVVGILISLHMMQPSYRKTIYALGIAAVALMPWQMMIATHGREAWQAITWPQAVMATAVVLGLVFGFLRLRDWGRLQAVTLACGAASFPLYVLHYMAGSMFIIRLYHAGVPWAAAIALVSLGMVAAAFLVAQVLAPWLGKYFDVVVRNAVAIGGRLTPEPIRGPLTRLPARAF